MDRDRSRVLVLLLAYLGLIAASLFFLDWFVAKTPFGHVAMDLRVAQICPDGEDACVTASVGSLRDLGWYGSVAGSTFWGTLVFSVLVVYQAAMRLTRGLASDRLSKVGYVAGMTLFGNAFAAGFLFAPESGPVPSELMSLDVTRSSAPFLMLIGLLLGITILYYAVTQPSDDVGAYKPLGNLPVRKPTEPPVAAAAIVKKHASDPGVLVPKKHTSDPGVPLPTAKKHPSSPGAVAAEPRQMRKSDPIAALASSIVPEHLRQKLQFSVLSANITRGGIDARREDGSSLLVIWRDVVGLVARRMPADYDSLPFLDVVSVAGSTLRLVPWTRLSGDGDVIAGAEDPRVLLKALMVHCPEASLDPATKKFLDSSDPPAQLPSLEKLAAHDGKLA